MCKFAGENHCLWRTALHQFDRGATGCPALLHGGLDDRGQVVRAERVDLRPVKTDHAQLVGNLDAEAFRRADDTDREQVALGDHGKCRTIGAAQ